MMRSKTYIATPPGETIKEQLINREMTQKEFAARMDISEKYISRLINGEVILTPETAVKLEMVLGILSIPGYGSDHNLSLRWKSERQYKRKLRLPLFCAHKRLVAAVFIRHSIRLRCRCGVVFLSSGKGQKSFPTSCVLSISFGLYLA